MSIKFIKETGELGLKLCQLYLLLIEEYLEYFFFHSEQLYFTDSMTAYTDYVYNLDKLTIYVTNKPVEDADELHGKSKCASVTRLNNALFNPRLHFDCPEPLEGRYLYVKASGVPNRWRRLFTVVLCEVMVYWRNVRKSQRFWSIFFTSLVEKKPIYFHGKKWHRKSDLSPPPKTNVRQE